MNSAILCQLSSKILYQNFGLFRQVYIQTRVKANLQEKYQTIWIEFELNWVFNIVTCETVNDAEISKQRLALN